MKLFAIFISYFAFFYQIFILLNEFLQYFDITLLSIFPSAYFSKVFYHNIKTFHLLVQFQFFISSSYNQSVLRTTLYIIMFDIFYFWISEILNSYFCPNFVLTLKLSPITLILNKQVDRITIMLVINKKMAKIKLNAKL